MRDLLREFTAVLESMEAARLRDFANLHDPDWVRRQLIAGGIAVTFATVLAVVGAFASDRYDPLQRVGYWTVIFLFWAIIARLAVRLIARGQMPGAPGRWKTLVAATALASVPMLAIVMLETAAVMNWQPNLEDFLEQIIGIWLLGGAYLFIVDRPFRHAPVPAPAAEPLPAAAPEPPEQPAEPAEPAAKLLEKLPGQRLEDILCLAGEDHYVRIHTRRGSALVLMRFKDALDEVAALDGSRVHRSWWVANGAVQGIARDGRVARLDLGSGLAVPVSQPYLADALARWGAASADRAGASV